MKILLLILMLAMGTTSTDHVPSRIRLFQSGTIPIEDVSKTVHQYQQFGCKQIGVFDVSADQVNVYCLDMLIGE